MSVASHWSGLSVVLLALNILFEFLLLAVASQRNLWRSLLLLPIFAAFCFLMDSIGTWVAFNSHGWGYWMFYWTAEAIGTAILVLLCAQIATILLPKWKMPIIGVWSVLILVFLIVIAVQTVPSHRQSDIRLLLTVADIAAVGMLLMISSMTIKTWPVGYGFLISGLSLSTILHLVFSIVGPPWTLYGYPGASLLGTILLLAGALLRPSAYPTLPRFDAMF